MLQPRRLLLAAATALVSVSMGTLAGTVLASELQAAEPTLGCNPTLYCHFGTFQCKDADEFTGCEPVSWGCQFC